MCWEWCVMISLLQPPKLFYQRKEWEKEGMLAARSQHTVHLEVSSALPLSQPVCCTPSPTSSNLPLTAVFFSSFQPLLLCVWGLGFLSLLHASAAHPNCEFNPQNTLTATVREDYDSSYHIWWFYCMFILHVQYFMEHSSMYHMLTAAWQDRVITIRRRG